MPILNLNEMKVESKLHEFVGKAKQKARDAWEWMKNNQEMAAGLLTSAYGLAAGLHKLGKGLLRTNNIRMERYNKERYIYDHSLGMYLHTKRPLKNKDYVFISNERQKGRKLSDVLQKMNILD